MGAPAHQHAFYCHIYNPKIRPDLHLCSAGSAGRRGFPCSQLRVRPWRVLSIEIMGAPARYHAFRWHTDNPSIRLPQH